MPSPISRQPTRPFPPLRRAPSLTLPRKRGREGWGKGRAGRGLRAIGAILAVVALAPALAACNDAATSAITPPIRPVQVQRVVFAAADENREFAGVVRARYETDLGFRVAG